LVREVAVEEDAGFGPEEAEEGDVEGELVEEENVRVQGGEFAGQSNGEEEDGLAEEG
jgi:hypothetical protein